MPKMSLTSKKYPLKSPYVSKQPFFFLVFLGPNPRHMEVPRLGAESELQLQAYTTATATPDHGNARSLILSKARDWTRNLMVPIRIH